MQGLQKIGMPLSPGDATSYLEPFIVGSAMGSTLTPQEVGYINAYFYDDIIASQLAKWLLPFWRSDFVLSSVH